MTHAQCIKCGVPLESPTSEGTCLACREQPAAKKKGSPIVRILVFLVVLGIFGGGVGVWYLSETSDTFEVLFASWVESSLPADGIKVKAPAAMETMKTRGVLSGEPRDQLTLGQGDIVYAVSCDIIPEGELGHLFRSTIADEEAFKKTFSGLIKREKIVRKVTINNVDFMELETWNDHSFLVMRTGIVGNRLIGYSLDGAHDLRAYGLIDYSLDGAHDFRTYGRPITPLLSSFGQHDITKNRSKISRFMTSIEIEPQASSRLTLVGKNGVSLTDLRPIGQVLIDGQQYRACAKEGMIPSGASILVVYMTPFNLMVRKAE